MSLTNPTGVTGDPIGDGLGPYSLTKPTGWTATLWTDNVNKDASAGAGTPFKWSGVANTNSVRYENATFKTAFIAWPLEAISNIAHRAAVLDSVINWFGCACAPLSSVDFTFDPAAPLEDETITFSGSAVSETPVTYAWNFADGSTGAGPTATHAYTAGGRYDVEITASHACSSGTATHTVAVRSIYDIFLPVIVK